MYIKNLSLISLHNIILCDPLDKLSSVMLDIIFSSLIWLCIWLLNILLVIHLVLYKDYKF